MTLLDQPFAIKKLTARNRLVLPPITTNYGSADNQVTDDTLTFYTRRSAHVGTAIVEATAVQDSGCIVPNSLGLWEDAQIPGMASLAAAIKDKGALAVVQLNHAGPRCSPKQGFKQGFSPSGIAFKPDVTPVIMTPDEIETLIRDFTEAAERALKAGFDAVEIHGAHLYLLSEFLSPLTNKRTDEYGGDAEGRSLLARKIVQSVRQRLGSDFPLFFRINGVEKIEGGQSLEDAKKIGTILSDAGVDVFDISLIAHGGWKEIDGKSVLVGSSALPKSEPGGATIAFTRNFKNTVQKPVIAVGKLGEGTAAPEAVQKSDIDLVALGRQMICDPDTAGKILDNRHDEISRCDECLKCFATILKGSPMGCKVNSDLPG